MKLGSLFKTPQEEEVLANPWNHWRSLRAMFPPNEPKANLWRRKILIFLSLFFLVFLLGSASFQGLGKWLVMEDPLERAAAIVILGGQSPYRAMEGASLYKGGWAAEVWVPSPVMREETKILWEMGIPWMEEERLNKMILERLGVPSTAIRVLPDRVRNTVEEVRLVSSLLRGKGDKPVILVTSKVHTRRTRATWRAIVGKSPRAIVRFAKLDPFDPVSWWRYTEDALAVVREVVGLLNVWAGFPLQPMVRSTDQESHGKRG
jgi:uncharacterized SAM-binding protein YcdF (DUF218 family)